MWERILNWLCTNGYYCSGRSDVATGNSVPELSTTVGPLAITVLAVLIVIGLERQKQKQNT